MITWNITWVRVSAWVIFPVSIACECYNELITQWLEQLRQWPFQLMNRVHVLWIRFTKSFNNGHSPSSVKTTDLGCLSIRFKLVIRHIGILFEENWNVDWFLRISQLQCIEIRHMVSIVSVQRKIGKLPKRVSYCKILDHKIYYIICTGSDHIFGRIFVLTQ